MSQPPSRYLHGTSPQEQERLSHLNHILNMASLHELSLAGGERIIDFGCGMAQFTRDMAQAAGPGGQVVGIERSLDQIQEGRRQAGAAGEGELIQVRQGEATAPPLRDDEWGSFDIAHARFLLEHVADPQAVVRAMVRAVRPGGRVVLADDDHDVLRLWPEPDGMLHLWRAYIRAFEVNGNDPYVGRRLISLLHEAGAAPSRNTWIFFGGCSGMPVLAALVENMIGLLEGARDPILATGSVDREGYNSAIEEFRRWGERPDAAFWFAMAWAEGIRRS